MLTIEHSRQRLRAGRLSAALFSTLVLAGSAGAEPIDPYAPEAAPLDPYVRRPALPPTVAQPRTTPPDPYEGYGPPPEVPQPVVPGACFTETCSEQTYRPAEAYVPTSPTASMPRRDTTRRNGLLVGGVLLLTGAWTISTVGAAVGSRGELAIPVFGPILTMVDLNEHYSRSPGLQAATAFLFIDLFAQSAGLVMAIVGGTTHRHATPRAVSWRAAGATF